MAFPSSAWETHQHGEKYLSCIYPHPHEMTDIPSLCRSEYRLQDGPPLLAGLNHRNREKEGAGQTP